MPPGAPRGDQGRVRAEREEGPGHMLLLGSLDGTLWASQAKTTLVNSDQKEWDFGKLHRWSYLRGTQGKGPGRLGRVLSTGVAVGVML